MFIVINSHVVSCDKRIYKALVGRGYVSIREGQPTVIQFRNSITDLVNGKRVITDNNYITITDKLIEACLL